MNLYPLLLSRVLSFFSSHRHNSHRRWVIRLAPFHTGGSRGTKIPGSATPKAKYEMNLAVDAGPGGGALGPDSLGYV